MVSHISVSPGLLKDSFPVLLPLTAQKIACSPCCQMMSEEKNNPAPVGELTIDAVHSTSQTELQVILAFFTSHMEHTACVTQVSPKLWECSSRGFLKPLFKMAFSIITSENEFKKRASQVVQVDKVLPKPQIKALQNQKTKAHILDKNLFCRQDMSRNFKMPMKLRIDSSAGMCPVNCNHKEILSFFTRIKHHSCIALIGIPRNNIQLFNNNVQLTSRFKTITAENQICSFRQKRFYFKFPQSLH